MEIFGLNWHIWMTIVLILGMFVTLFKTKLPADVVFLAVMGLLIVTGCISANEAIKGFSTETVVVVGVLFVVVAGLDATGVLQWVVKHLLGQPSSYLRAILRLMLPVAFLSAFLSNATVVALFIKVVKLWAEKLKIAPSKLLIPLSYAACMGGVCTIIGTPPNLIVSGFYADKMGERMGLFTTALPGLFCLAVGITTIIVLQRLLPSRKSPEDELGGVSNLATTELKIPADSHLPGQTLADINLAAQCRESRLIGIIHYDGEVEQVAPDASMDDYFLMGSDTLVFTGNRREVLQIAKRNGMVCNAYDRDEDEVKQGWRTLLSSVIMMTMVILSALDIVPLLNGCFMAALLMLLTKCCSVKQAKAAINWDVLMVFACSVTLGKAIDETGLAHLLASHMSDFCGTNAVLALVIICTMATFLTEFISNTACGAIMAPVAIQIATSMGVSPLPFCIGLMIAVSSSFATPIGSPTHLLVYVPGGYRFSDFARIGLPMNFIILAANLFITLMLFPL